MVLPRRDESEASLTSVAEMIDTAFGYDEENIVDFGSVRAILLIIARSLCVLDRQVAVKLPYTQMVSQGGNITINEIKVSAKGEKKTVDQNELGQVPEHIPTKTKFHSSRTSHQSDRNSENSPKNNETATDKLHNNKLEKKNKTMTLPDEKTNKNFFSTQLTDPSNATETHKEKILIVERRPTTVLFLSSIDLDRPINKTTQTLVTREQYNTLKDQITQLQQRYGLIDPALHESASFSNPIAVLQISARLEIIERAIEEMKKLLGKAFKMSLTSDNNLLKNSPKWQTSIARLKSSINEDIRKNRNLLLNIKVLTTDQLPDHASNTYGVNLKDTTLSKNKIDVTLSMMSMTEHGSSNETRISTDPLCLTFEELRYRIKQFAEEMAKATQNQIYKITLKSETALQNRMLMGGKLARVLQIPPAAVESLEIKVNEFTNNVSKTDVTLSKTTTKYYEDLLALENEMATKFENLADAMSKELPENDDIPELLSKFNKLLNDIEVTHECQDQLYLKQSNLFDSIKTIRKILSELQHAKANRDDVEKAIECKIGRAAINGIETLIHFNSVLGIWEKNLKSLFENLRGQEMRWQENINAVWTKIDESVDKAHIKSLREDIYKNIYMLNDKLDSMLHLCNSMKTEDDTNAARILNQDSCICCKTVEYDTGNGPLKITRQKINAEPSDKEKHTFSPDKFVCYRNLPIPHPLGARSKTCGRCIGVLKTNSEFGTTESLVSSIIVCSASHGTTSVATSKEIITPCKQCNESKPEIITIVPIKSSKPQTRSFKRTTKQSDKSQKATRDSFSSEKSKRSHTSNRSTKRSIHRDQDSVSEESEVEPVFIILDDD